MAQLLMLVFTGLYMITMNRVLHFPTYWYATCYGVNLGMLTMHYETDLRAFVQKNVPLCVIAAVLTMSIWCMAEYMQLSMQSLFWGLTSPFVVLMMVYLGGLKINRVTAFLGKYSYEIYLVHGALFCIYPYMPLTGSWHDGMFVVVLFGLTIVLAIGLQKVSKLIMK